MSSLVLDKQYQSFLIEIKQYYRSAQLKAAYAVNQEMIQFYWQLGKQILELQAKTQWGSKFLEQLSKDSQTEFPGTSGFSTRNLIYMRKFAETYTEITQQPAAQLPWGHIMVLLDQVSDPKARDWYASNALKNGIARSVLKMQIDQDLYSRQGKDAHKVTNFKERLPSPQSDLALQLFKDPYDFRFLPVTEGAEEQIIEGSMISYLSKVFLEMGTGFAYMGNQYKLTVDGTDFFWTCYFIMSSFVAISSWN